MENFTPISIILIILLIVALITQYRSNWVDMVKFYEELRAGDVFEYHSDSNVFTQPVELITVIDKKDNYVKYTIEIQKTGEIIEKSCSRSDFYDICSQFGIVRRK